MLLFILSIGQIFKGPFIWFNETISLFTCGRMEEVINQGVLLLGNCQPQLPASHEVEWLLVPEAGCHEVSEAHCHPSLMKHGALHWVDRVEGAIQTPWLDHGVSEIGQRASDDGESTGTKQGIGLLPIQ